MEELVIFTLLLSSLFLSSCVLSIFHLSVVSLFIAYRAPLAIAKSLSLCFFFFICECLAAVESNMYGGRGGSDCLN